MKSRSLRNVCLMATFVSAVAVISSCGNGSQQTQQAPPPTIATITAYSIRPFDITAGDNKGKDRHRHPSAGDRIHN